MSKRIDTYTAQNPVSGDKALGVSGGETRLLNIGSAALKDHGTAADQVPLNSDLEPLPAGMIMPYAGTAAPTGWLACDGSAVSRTTYADLFTAISTTWGVGDGSLTFNLPDLRGAFLRGTGAHGTETDAGGTAFTGPAVGAYQDDQMQRITGGGGSDTLWAPGSFFDNATGVFSGSSSNSGARGNVGSNTSGILDFDSANSPDARTSATTGGETRPFGAGVYYCIKI